MALGVQGYLSKPGSFLSHEYLEPGSLRVSSCVSHPRRIALWQ